MARGTPVERRRGMILIVVGIVVVATGFDALIGPPLVALARTWLYTPCEGVLHESSVIDRGSGGRHAYGVVCDYEYEFGGVARRGDVFRRGMPFATRAGAESALERVKREDTLTVYVDAGRPERAVLSRGLTGGEVLFGAATVGLNAVAAGMMLVFALRFARGR